MRRKGPEPKSVSLEEMEHLLAIATAAHGFVHHELIGEGGLVSVGFDLLQEFFDGKSTAKDLRKIEPGFNRVKRASARFLRLYHDHLNEARVTSLRSSLPNVAAMVVSNLAKRGLSQPATEGPPIQVLFPENALYYVALELSRNAAVHASGFPSVLEWYRQDADLVVAVHDGGGSLFPRLTDRVVRMELAFPEFFGGQGGLSIVRRIVHSSHGHLLARRSPRLQGGVELSFRFSAQHCIVEIEE